MTAGLKTRLTVNGVPVDLSEYAHNFITQIVICAVSMLKGGTDVKTLVFNLENNRPSLTVNEKDIPFFGFPKDALPGTFRGMVSSLRGINEINSLRIEIHEA